MCSVTGVEIRIGMSDKAEGPTTRTNQVSSLRTFPASARLELGSHGANADVCCWAALYIDEVPRCLKHFGTARVSGRVTQVTTLENSADSITYPWHW